MVYLARITLLLLLLSMLLPSPRRGALAQPPAPLLVIVGKATPIYDVSLATLRRVFQGERTEYAAGQRFIPFNLPAGVTERNRFDLMVLGLAPENVGRYWIDRRIRDEAAPPRLVPSPLMAMKVVASLRGAISYVSEASLSASVRVLTVDGMAASQPGYPLAR